METPAAGALPAIGDANAQKLLGQLIEKTTKTFGDRLVSLVLYGSAASGEYDGAFSDLNILCVLRSVTVGELRDSEPIFRWWRQHGNPAPLLLSEQEVRTSTDCFSIEFHDMAERRRILAGVDIIDSLEIDDSFYRAQVEHELRAKLLRLRQKAAGVIDDSELLCRLMAESVSTFCILLRHALRLAGHAAPMTRMAILDDCERKLGLTPKPFLEILALRSKRIRHSDVESKKLFEQYLEQISLAVNAVDTLSK